MADSVGTGVGRRVLRSALSTASALALTLVNGVLSLVVTRQVILHYGSDFNGVNTTANQFITILMLLEGGITLATNVALFKPLVEGNHFEMNAIMSATNRTFRKLGSLILVTGLIGSFVYAFFVRSQVPYGVVAATLVMTAVSTAFTLGVVGKYTVLIQTQQREYVLSNIRIITTVLTQVTIMIGILIDAHMLWVRTLTMLGAVLNGLLVVWWARRTDSWLDFSASPNFEAVRGTRDVLAQKLTGAVYSAAPLIVLSATVGAVAGSIYAVYDMASTFLKGILYAVANGPRMGIGQIAAEQDGPRTRRVFLSYEALVTQATLVLGATAFPLFVPFIRLYTHGVADAAYVDWVLASLVCVVLVLELAHIPAGHLINLTGHFRVARNIQWTGLAVLTTGLGIGVTAWGLHGMVGAVAVGAAALCVLEIGYTHVAVVPGSVVDYMRLAVLPALGLTTVSVMEAAWLPVTPGVAGFALTGILLAVANGVISVIFGWLCHSRVYRSAWARVLGVFRQTQ